MGSLHGPTPTSAEQLADQLKQPSANAIWNRALEVSQRPQLLKIASLHEIGACQTAGSAWIHGWRPGGDPGALGDHPEEFNVLLNPKHVHYDALAWSEPRPFRFDPRLFLTEPQTL